MPNRIEERIETKIGNHEIATYSKSDGDFLEIITDNSYCNFGIILADTVGHSKKEGLKIKREIMKNCGKWYLKKTPFNSIYSLAQNIGTWEKMITKTKKEREKESGELTPLESSCLSYTMFSDKKITNMRAGMPAEIIISNKNILYGSQEGIPPIGYVNKLHQKFETKLNLKKGDILILYTDGLKENPLICDKIKRRIQEIEEKEKKFHRDLSTLPNQDEKIYQKNLMRIVEEHPDKTIDELREIIKSEHIEMKYNTLPTNKATQKKPEIKSEEIKEKIAQEIRKAQEDIKKEFKDKLFEIIKKDYKKSSTEIIENILNLKEYFLPTKPHHDDVTIAIIKKL